MTPSSDEEAQLVHHQPVAALAHLERREHVGVHAVEEFRRIRSLDLDLAERRGIEQANLVPHTEDLAVDRSVLVFAALRIGIGAAPLAHGLPHRTLVQMPLIDGGAADRQEQVLGERTSHRSRTRRAYRAGGTW